MGPYFLRGRGGGGGGRAGARAAGGPPDRGAATPGPKEYCKMNILN
jgi:hypothetical protein